MFQIFHKGLFTIFGNSGNNLDLYCLPVWKDSLEKGITWTDTFLLSAKGFWEQGEGHSCTKLFIFSGGAAAGAVFIRECVHTCSNLICCFHSHWCILLGIILKAGPGSSVSPQRGKQSYKSVQKHSNHVLPRSLQAYKRGRRWKIQEPIRGFRD